MKVVLRLGKLNVVNGDGGDVVAGVVEDGTAEPVTGNTLGVAIQETSLKASTWEPGKRAG